MKLTFSEAKAKGLEGIEQLLDDLTREKMKSDPGLQYHQALKLVASEHREIDQTRTALQRQKAEG